MECYISYLVAHNLDDKHTAVRRSRRMDPVDRIRGDIHSALESECHVGSPQVIVDRLRQGDNIESLLAEQVRRLVGSVSSKNNETVQVQLMICMFHSLYLVKSVLVRYSHQFKRLSRRAENRTAPCQDS